ncbi:hypothetical protein F5B20DRAFT_502935 [Whalleya microplaca]|nr:hypothetical protein F5B20DRAFT_502935 [Whalleya microplaca]
MDEEPVQLPNSTSMKRSLRAPGNTIHIYNLVNTRPDHRSNGHNYMHNRTGGLSCAMMGNQHERESSHIYLLPKEIVSTIRSDAKPNFRMRISSWFVRGRVFMISGDHGDSVTSGRTMVVIARSRDSSSSVCLSLCRHEDISIRQNSFLAVRVPLSATANQLPTANIPTGPFGLGSIELIKGNELLSDV